MPSVSFFRLTVRSVLCVCMERNSLPTVPGTDNSHNRQAASGNASLSRHSFIFLSVPSTHESSPVYGTRVRSNSNFQSKAALSLLAFAYTQQGEIPGPSL